MWGIYRVCGVYMGNIGYVLCLLLPVLGLSKGLLGGLKGMGDQVYIMSNDWFLPGYIPAAEWLCLLQSVPIH